ncbi:uncharacterized protein Iris [Venturia canescens]|uniref:uncharacterized protein Iris n=1 Tax=Venturia canescens TaxID=32260 RepID=UPI001C9CC5CF|nr:uncharacterized protein LOC122416732 [Venturia canescens]
MHIVDAKLQDLHNEHVAEVQRVKDVYRFVAEMHAELRELANNTAIAHYNLTIIDYGNRVINQIDNFIRAGEKYILIIGSAINGRFDPSAISRSQLLDIAHEAQAHGGGLEFPYPVPYLRPENLVHLARTDILSQESRVIIIVRVPLLDHSVYDLYRVMPWPVPQRFHNGSGSASVAPSSPYIALARDRRTFFLADGEYVTQCKISGERRLFSGGIPVLDVTTDVCELRMLLSPSRDALHMCDIRLHNSPLEYWSYLPTHGGWLFSITNTIKLRIACLHGPTQEIPMSGMGVLQLETNCVGTTPTTTLSGLRTYTSKNIYYYEPGITLNISSVAPTLDQHGGMEAAMLSRKENIDEGGAGLPLHSRYWA